MQPEDDEAIEIAHLADLDSAQLEEVGDDAIAQMVANDPELAALFGMDADGGSVAKSLSDTPSMLESQTVSEEELAQMFGDDNVAIADWKQFTDADVLLPLFGNDNTHALEGRELLHEGYSPFLPCFESQWCSLDTLGPLIFGADKWSTISMDALSKAPGGAESTLNSPLRVLSTLLVGSLPLLATVRCLLVSSLVSYSRGLLSSSVNCPAASPKSKAMVCIRSRDRRH